MLLHERRLGCSWARRFVLDCACDPASLARCGAGRNRRLRVIGYTPHSRRCLDTHKVLRTALESITRGWRYERTIRIRGARIPITVSPSAGLRYLVKPLSRVDPLLVAQARDFVKQGDVIWDAGANIGLFAFCAAAFAGQAGRVIAFEPDSWLAATLRRSAQRQPAISAPVEVVCEALAGMEGMRRLHIAKRSRSANFLEEYESLVPFITGGTLEIHSVHATTLDAALDRWPAPMVVKIDIEGAELETLRGGAKLLREIRPIILCEVFAPKADAVTEIFHANGYRLVDAQTRREVASATWSTIALPLASARRGA
jgi:FkbM family methyltransferase